MFKPKREQMNFFDIVYETTVPKNHFLRKLAKVLDWDSFEPQLSDLYYDTGRQAHNPVMMFKAIVLQFLYDLSDRKLQEQITGFMPFRWFLGLDPLALAPNYSAYCRFRDRLGEDKIAELFNQVVMSARSRKLVTDRLSIVDATVVKAKVDTYKMNAPLDDNDEQNGPKSKIDPDASYGHKTKNEPFFGYKAAVAVDADSGIATKVTATTGAQHDSKHFVEVCETQAKGTVADKGYDAPRNFAHLKKHKCRAGIIPKRRRGKKIGHIQARYRESKDYQWYYLHKHKRPLIERFFADAKCNHGLRVARYWSLTKMRIQATLTALAVNLKRMVRLMEPSAQKV